MTVFVKRIPLRLFLSLAICLSVGPTARGDDADDANQQASEVTRKSAVLAGGCFWCVEADFEKCPGVIDVISGYSGGRSENPTYETYAGGGHREVVFISYDPEMVTFAGLVEWLIKHVDPTDRTGQFNDHGPQYSPAIYYENEQERDSARAVIAAMNKEDVFPGKKITIPVEPRRPFWQAEVGHQDYHHKNSLKYGFYRFQSGRDRFTYKHWGSRAGHLELPASTPDADTDDSENAPSWIAFRKPSQATLKRQLSQMQYYVTQEDGTEPAFNNLYWNNKRKGIYVDVVSGAPLFSSNDKYESGTGWPSFVKPIAEDAVFFQVDRKMFVPRTEVRSRFGNSHLGHVFSDGPRQRGGKRYCMNSAALKFIPKDEMDQQGYGDYLKFVD